MSENPETHAVCPFCRTSLLQSAAVMIGIWPTKDRETNQSFLAHRKCLRERFPTGTVLHPALLDDDDPALPEEG